MLVPYKHTCKYLHTSKKKELALYIFVNTYHLALHCLADLRCSKDAILDH